MNEVQAKIEGGKLIITMPYDAIGAPSATGKTMVHSSSHGNQATACMVNGKPLIIGLNAYTKR